ncbi:restriction endonuclease subunit S [Muribacter muris]|uniref:restriction endonuclease subunit S n=1 Tax=Muribacter muris TaxID=67855 RepID=UPI00064DD293|nr:restriction endonuclease subunit S [Muribacter muris]
MSDWKKYKLCEIGIIKTGKTPPSKCNNAFSNFSGIPFVTPKDMVGSKWISHTERYLTKDGLNTVSNYLVDENSISVSCIGSDMGKAALLKNKSVTNQQINTLTVNQKHNYEYIYYILSKMQDFFKSISGGSATPILNKSDFSNIEILLPDIETQNRNIEYLKYLDEKIQLNTQINQTLENIAQAIFKSWCIDFDPVRAKATALADGLTPAQAECAAMSVISGKNAAELDRLQTENPDQYQQLQQLAQAFPSEFEEVEGFGEVPRGWDILKFKDFVTESKEKVGERTGIEEFSVGNNGITPRSEKYKKSLSKTPEKNKIINNGYVVFGMGSQTLNWGIMQLGEGSVSPAYFVYKTNEKIVNYQYLSLFIKAYEQDYQSLIKPTSRQGQSVDREMFLAKEIYIPDNKLLNIFMSTYHSIIKLKDSLNNEIDILVKTRDELLPKLLSGEI